MLYESHFLKLNKLEGFNVCVRFLSFSILPFTQALSANGKSLKVSMIEKMAIELI